MSLETNKTFTLGDLAKIALGATELTNDHLSVFQSLLVILLQKLNCHNERVCIHGFPAKSIQELLNGNTNCSKFNFQIETIKKFQEKYELLEVLERKTEEIDLKMQQHFKTIRNCHKSGFFSAQHFDFYASPTEDLCTVYMQHNKEFCLLARGSAFNRELQSRVLPLVMARFKKFESKIEGMQNQLQEITQKADKIAPQLKQIEFIIKDIQKIDGSLYQKNETFREAMLELEEMLNCKLHRIVLPALKRYLERHFEAVMEYLKDLSKVSKECPPTKPFIIEDEKTCLSCDPNQQFSQESKKFQTLLSIDNEKKKFCSVTKKSKSSILDKIDRIQSSASKLDAPSNSYVKKVTSRGAARVSVMQSHNVM